MKLRIDGFNCLEDDLFIALTEAKKILEATDLITIEVKIFHGKTRENHIKYSFITVTKQSNPNELCQIVELKGKVSQLVDELEKFKK
jgi:hypothetical protein